MDEGPGCLGTFLIFCGALVIAAEVGKKVVAAVAPYVPLLVLGGGTVLIVYFCRHLITAELERWWKRRQAEPRARQRIEQARAEIRFIHHQTARQMERAKRRAGR